MPVRRAHFVAGLLFVSFSVAGAETTDVEGLLRQHLAERIKPVEGGPPVTIVVDSASPAEANRGRFTRIILRGGPLIVKNVRVEELSFEAEDAVIDVSVLKQEGDFKLLSAKRKRARGVITDKALTDRANLGRNTKELESTITFNEHDVHVDGRFKYSILKGRFQAIGKPLIVDGNQVRFKLQQVTVNGGRVPPAIVHWLEKKIKPIDMGDIFYIDEIDKLEIKGDRLCVSAAE